MSHPNHNSNDDGGEDSRKLWPFFFIIPILGFSFLPITGIAPVQVPGQWENFPCGQTNCNCSINSGDECQLFNNEAYYGIYSISPDGNLGNAGGLSAGFSVDCVSPATPTTGGSVLYLQYANYSLGTVWDNVTNFKTIGSTIYIDNTLGWDCPGHLENNTAGNLPMFALNTTVHGFIFRVIGACGCAGSGNAGKPVLTNVNVLIFQAVLSTISFRIAATFTNRFVYTASLSYPALGSTTINSRWIATNQTASSCGFLSDVCIQSGTASCVITVSTCPSTTVNFSVSFSGAPQVVMSPSTAPTTRILQVAAINIFATEL